MKDAKDYFTNELDLTWGSLKKELQKFSILDTNQPKLDSPTNIADIFKQIGNRQQLYLTLSAVTINSKVPKEDDKKIAFAQAFMIYCITLEIKPKQLIILMSIYQSNKINKDNFLLALISDTFLIVLLENKLKRQQSNQEEIANNQILNTIFLQTESSINLSDKTSSVAIRLQAQIAMLQVRGYTLEEIKQLLQLIQTDEKHKLLHQAVVVLQIQNVNLSAHTTLSLLQLFIVLQYFKYNAQISHPLLLAFIEKFNAEIVKNQHLALAAFASIGFIPDQIMVLNLFIKIVAAIYNDKNLSNKENLFQSVFVDLKNSSSILDDFQNYQNMLDWVSEAREKSLNKINTERTQEEQSFLLATAFSRNLILKHAIIDLDIVKILSLPIRLQVLIFRQGHLFITSKNLINLDQSNQNKKNFLEKLETIKNHIMTQGYDALLVFATIPIGLDENLNSIMVSLFADLIIKIRRNMKGSNKLNRIIEISITLFPSNISAANEQSQIPNLAQLNLWIEHMKSSLDTLNISQELKHKLYNMPLLDDQGGELKELIEITLAHFQELNRINPASNSNQVVTSYNFNQTFNIFFEKMRAEGNPPQADQQTLKTETVEQLSKVLQPM